MREAIDGCEELEAPRQTRAQAEREGAGESLN